MEREKESPFSEVRGLKKLERGGGSPACPKIQQGGKEKCRISPTQCYPIGFYNGGNVASFQCCL